MADSLPLQTQLLSDGVSLYRLRYRVLLVTWRRRPLFEDAAVRVRVDALVRAAGHAMGCSVTNCEMGVATVEVYVEAPPGRSPREIVNGLREGVSGPLAAEVGAVADAVRQWGGVFVPRWVVTTAPVAETACGEE